MGFEVEQRHLLAQTQILQLEGQVEEAQLELGEHGEVEEPGIWRQPAQSLQEI